MPFEKGSLILVDYTARVKDTNEVFETTIEEEAKKTAQLYDPTRKYEPRLVSVGESWVLKGLDEALAKANVGDRLNVEITPDKGFGERDPNKVRMIPQRKLGDKADEVGVGDVIEVDDRTGIVRYVGSGRIQVDFNHRFAGKTLLYDVNVTKKLETDNEKIVALVRRRTGLEESKVKINLAAPNLEIELPEEAFLAEGLQIVKRAVANDIFKFVPSVKNVKFVETYSAAPAEQQKQEEEQPKAETATPEAKQ
ncbi:MAG TPA: FKBP-type peptidyl-prolyl cis-trans isomerase [Nitrososphaera sp.]|jgi:peptidylprolyl isomerase